MLTDVLASTKLLFLLNGLTLPTLVLITSFQEFSGQLTFTVFQKPKRLVILRSLLHVGNCRATSIAGSDSIPFSASFKTIFSRIISPVKVEPRKIEFEININGYQEARKFKLIVDSIRQYDKLSPSLKSLVSSLQTQLKEFLDSVSLTEKAQREAEVAQANQTVLSRGPLEIFIG